MIRMVIVEQGLSTDMSPRYGAYLTFSSLAEMGNITADFEISQVLWEVTSVKRLSAGVYELKGQDLSGQYGAPADVTYTIDATQVFADEAALRKNCGEDFCDKALTTSIQITRDGEVGN